MYFSHAPFPDDKEDEGDALAELDDGLEDDAFADDEEDVDYDLHDDRDEY